MSGILSDIWQMAAMMAEGDIRNFIDIGEFVVLPSSSEPPAPHQQAEYVPCGGLDELIKTATAGQYRLMSVMEDNTRKVRLSETKTRSLVRRWKQGLTRFSELDPEVLRQIDMGDIDVPVVWIRRTRASGGHLLYPRWVGETRASEARLRAERVGDLLLR
jgi:hypothetical protein